MSYIKKSKIFNSQNTNFRISDDIVICSNDNKTVTQNEINSQTYALTDTVNQIDSKLNNISSNMISISNDIVDCKTKLVAQLTNKGVKAYNTESLTDLVRKIEQIPQTVFKGVSEFEGVVLAPPAWNPASIAHNLQEETLPAYFPAYMDDYRKDYLSYWVAESMYTNIKTATLEGADGYYTSDGHFYQKYGTQYIHTFPNGITETITDSIHTWDNDGSVNRFVVYFYLSNSYSINFKNYNKYTKLVIVGQCGGITLTGANTITDIWNFGEITGSINVNQTSGNAWHDVVSIRGYKHHANTVLIYNRMVSVIYLPDLEECSYNLISPGSDYKSYAPNLFILPKLKKINTRPFLLAGGLTDLDTLSFLHLPALKELTVPLISISGQPYHFANGLQYIELNNLEVLNITSTGIISYDSSVNGSYGSLNRITIPKLKRINSGFIMYSRLTTCNFALNLIDIEVGEMETNLNLQHWNPTDVLSNITKTKRLLENIKNHIALKVSDRSGLSALSVTFKFTSSLNSHSDSEVIATWTEIKQIFTNKNWNVL